MDFRITSDPDGFVPAVTKDVLLYNDDDPNRDWADLYLKLPDEKGEGRGSRRAPEGIGNSAPPYGVHLNFGLRAALTSSRRRR